MFQKRLPIIAASLLLAADAIKIGFVSTRSGLGVDNAEAYVAQCRMK